MSLRRQLSPPAKLFYELELGQLSRPDPKGWSKGRCPFHRSKSGKSLSVNIRTGAWCCFAGCGKGDLIGFAMRHYNTSFRAACERLGAWVKDGKPLPARKKEQPKSVARMIAEAVVNGPEPSEIQVLRTIYREACGRLTALKRGDREAYAGEQEHCEEIMSLALADLRHSGWEGIEP